MDNSDIYNKAKIEALNHIKHLRNAYASRDELSDPTTKSAFDSIMFDVMGKEHREYTFITESVKKHTLKMVSDIICGLLEKYHVSTTPVDFGQYGIFPVPVMAFVQLLQDEKRLYIIKEFGLSHNTPEAVVRSFTEQINASYYYVSLVKENAFAEILNHNEDESDPSRGTRIISLPFFLQLVFGEQEKNDFIKFADTYVAEVRNYLGLTITKSLTPNALYSFKRSSSFEALHFDYYAKYQELYSSKFFSVAISEIREEERKKSLEKKFFTPKSTDSISPEQWEIIRQQYQGDLCYKALTGKADFSQTFMTAEWLYDTMKKAGRIDYSPVAMGYFKSIEQLIWGILALHKKETISIKRKGAKSFIMFNDPAMNWDERNNADKADTTIGALMGALDFNSNRVIFRKEISDKTIDIIVILVRTFKNLRNGYTHKDNINDWRFIDTVRNTAFVLYYLLLGSVNLSVNDKTTLEIPVDQKSDYQKLCEYINYNSSRPYYLIDDCGHRTVVIALPDDNMIIDENGDAEFSGIYVKPALNVPWEPYIISKDVIISNKKNSTYLVGEVYCIGKNELPSKIYLGAFTPVAEGMKYSGPLQLIFDAGIFIDPGLTVKPEY